MPSGRAGASRAVQLRLPLFLLATRVAESNRNDQVETAFYLQKHHGTLRRAGGGRKVER